MSSPRRDLLGEPAHHPLRAPRKRLRLRRDPRAPRRPPAGAGHQGRTPPAGNPDARARLRRGQSGVQGPRPGPYRAAEPDLGPLPRPRLEGRGRACLDSERNALLVSAGPSSRTGTSACRHLSRACPSCHPGRRASGDPGPSLERPRQVVAAVLDPGSEAGVTIGVSGPRGRRPQNARCSRGSPARYRFRFSSQSSATRSA